MQGKRSVFFLIPFVLVAALLFAAAWAWSGQPLAQPLMLTILVLGTIPYVLRMLADIRRGHVGVDIIAILAIVASIILEQWIAAGVILLMLSGGEALEEYALARARLKLTELLSRAPSQAHRKRGGRITDIRADQVLVGDILVIKPGEVVPVDGLVLEGESSVDQSMITGESLPVEKNVHSQLMSGSVNINGVLTIQALRISADSKYQQIVNLVRNAEAEKVPLVRLADRYSLLFTGITALISTAAWFMSHDPIRVLAVLVVATPCPLIIATPIAVMSAISEAAGRGIIVKNGGALETLGRIKALVFDKTGTLTFGVPLVADVTAFGGVDGKEVLRLAASLDQLSSHVLARSLVRHAKLEKLSLALPERFDEVLAQGVEGTINGRTYYLGKLAFIQGRHLAITPEVTAEYRTRQDLGEKVIFLTDEHAVLGSISFADEIRSESKNVFADFLKLGLHDITILSGDKTDIVKRVARRLGVGQVLGDLEPEEKVEELKTIQQRVRPVAMIGDGVNDAPALTAADVGIAMGAHGATVASETADIVITVDSLAKVTDVIRISRRMLRIARESIFIGIGVSILLMIAAALGYIQPVVGAGLQEVLDILVILNALRVGMR
ncbi:MAG TPA: heavy metal translocating P-type ATPase [Verrucomicrobiae bacterium]|nr:heavy metal translocating P-type ATPase [Verrucomicrobiae bacterium]